MALLVRGRRRILHDAHVARVEMVDEALDRAALARGVPALEEHAQRRPDLRRQLAAEPQPQPEQPLLGGGELLRLLLARELEREIEGIEVAHGGSP